MAPRLPVALTRSGPGVYLTEAAQLPVAGDWQLDVAVRTTDINRTTIHVDIPVR